jgi:hypothetical protein
MRRTIQLDTTAGTHATARQLPVLTIGGGNLFGATTMGEIRNPLQIATLLPGVIFSVPLRKV